MKRCLQISAILFLTVFFSCSSSEKITQRTSGTSEYPHKIYLMMKGWHTGIILEVNEASLQHIPELADFKHKKYVDIGWGNAEYYRIPGFDIKLGLKALLVPSPSALKVKGFDLDAEDYISTADYALEFALSPREFQNICAALSRSYMKNTNGKPEILENRKDIIIFYKAEELYHLFNTCNTWAGGVIQNGGFDVSTSGVISAKQLFDEVKDFGRIIKEKE